MSLMFARAGAILTLVALTTNVRSHIAQDATMALKPWGLSISIQ